MESVYLDHAATTSVRDEVRAAMEPFWSERFGNPSSVHARGRDAAAALDRARSEVAEALGARPGEIRFVRGGTESDNLAVVGACRAAGADGSRPRLVTSRVEHSAVLEPAEHLAATGAVEIDWLEVTPTGQVDLTPLRAETSRGLVTSVMWVNNETGLILPIHEIADACAATGGLFHTDASQAVGKVPVNVAELPVDLLTATGHKINGPKGVGILYVRDGTRIEPLVRGGGQERGLRPGTEDVAGAVGLAVAIRLAVTEREDFAERCVRLRARLERGLGEALGELRVNCGDGPRAPHVSSIGFPAISDGRTLVMALDLEGVAVSGGSACHSGAEGASHVIAALYGADDSLATVRYSFGKTTTEADVDRAVVATARVVRRQRGAAA